jgi:hypothetical protein
MILPGETGMHTQTQTACNIQRLAWLALLTFALLLWVGQPANAQEVPGQSDPFWSSDTCLACHQQSDLSVPLPSNETLSLAVFRGEYERSVHGQTGVQCRNCHLDITGFPHPELTARSLSDYSAQQAGTCEMCHRDHYTKVADELHTDAGRLLCSDCHDPHTTGTGQTVSAEVQVSCNECHRGGVTIPTEGIHSAPEVPEPVSTSGLTILLVVGGLLIGFVVLVWLAMMAWRSVRQRG